MGVNSKNRVKPNTLVKVRLSCGFVGVLTISFLRITLTWLKMKKKTVLVGLTLGVDYPPPRKLYG